MNNTFILGFILVIGIGIAAVPAVSAQWDGGDSDNNPGDSDDDSSSSDDDDESSDGDWGGGDSDSNTGEDNEGEVPEEDESDEDTSSSSSGSSGNLHIIDGLPGGSLDVQLSQDTIMLGESVTIEGELTNEDNADREVEIYLNNDAEETLNTDSNGQFQHELTPDESGEHTVTVEIENLNQDLDLQVTEDGDQLSIEGLTSSIGSQAGERTTVCANVVSPTDEAEVTLYHNNQEFETQTGSGQVCFDPVLQEGENNFRMVAEVNGQSTEEETSRNIGDGSTEPNGETDQDTFTGGFLGANTTTAVLGILGIIAASGILTLVMRRQGYALTRNP